MIGTERQIVLIVALLQFRQKLDLLEIACPVVEFEWQWPHAHLANHFTVVVCILLPEVLRRFFLNR